MNLLLLGGAALAFLWWINNRPVVIGSQEFFRPDLVQHIAAGMPQDEDAFILAAWRYVAQSYIYEPIGSDMVFVNGQILCEDCYLPGESLDRDRGNCVAKSALLASILATRLSNERIHIIIGSFGLDRQMGGHAWVEVFRHGTWYLLEATAPPGPNPWVTADSKFPEYDPGVMITNGKVVCADEFYCASFASCNCLEVLRK